MFNKLVVCSTARAPIYLQLFHKHAGFCKCYWCVKDSVFIDNKHLGHCGCKWCSLDNKGVLEQGTNVPDQISKIFSTSVLKHLCSYTEVESDGDKHFSDTSLATLSTSSIQEGNWSDQTFLDILNIHVNLTSSSQGSGLCLSISSECSHNIGGAISTLPSTQGTDTYTCSDTNEYTVFSTIDSCSKTMGAVFNFSGSLPHNTHDIQGTGSGNYSLIEFEGATSEGNDTKQQQGEVTHTELTNKMKWGFIPTTSFRSINMGDTQVINHKDMKVWVKLAHEKARQYDVPNYLGARIQVVSQLNIKQWRHLLADYELNRVCDYIQFGFPLSLDYANFNYNHSVKNHASAIQFPRAVDDYLETERNYNAAVGPLEDWPFPRLHVSPMMTRPKSDGTRRIIVDLSWPHGNSVNSYIPDNVFDDVEFTLRYPTVDHIVEQIASLGPTALLYKIDLKRAYRNLRSDPRDFSVLGLQWRDKCYIDISVPFGLKSGASACQMATQCVTHLMMSQGHWTCAYLDDILGVALPHKAKNAFMSLNNLIVSLGLPVNQNKVVAPAEEMLCLGININAKTGMLTIPREKILQIKELCKKWLSRAYATRKSLQKLLGHLIYLHKCVQPSRLFVNRILQVLRNTPSQGRVSLNASFYRDVNWFTKFLQSYNGVTKIHTKDDNYTSVYVDASLKAIGAFSKGCVYYAEIPECYKLILNIVHLEMLNVMVAFRTWGHDWENLKVKVFCDNYAVVNILNNGRTRDPFLSACARSIWLVQAKFNIQVSVEHIQGQCNTYADTLSRWHHFKNCDSSTVNYLKLCDWYDIQTDTLQPDFYI